MDNSIIIKETPTNIVMKELKPIKIINGFDDIGICYTDKGDYALISVFKDGQAIKP